VPRLVSILYLYCTHAVSINYPITQLAKAAHMKYWYHFTGAEESFRAGGGGGSLSLLGASTAKIDPPPLPPPPPPARRLWGLSQFEILRECAIGKARYSRLSILRTGPAPGHATCYGGDRLTLGIKIMLGYQIFMTFWELLRLSVYRMAHRE
jgi:hypothetical protein